VISNSPADKSGIKKGDIIVKFDGKKVSDAKKGLVYLVNKKSIGDVVDIVVWRDGKSLNLKVKLEGGSQ
jgi:serine protease Do